MATRRNITESSTIPGRPDLLAGPASASGSGSGVGTAPGLTEPLPLTSEMVATLTAQAAVEMGPVLTPPGVTTQADIKVAESITGTWRQNVVVTALWSINETRNAWIHLQNIGWKKIFNSRDGAFTTLVTLASQAKQTNRPITCREESDGMIYEIYLW
jgi:hypothetical protein